MDEETKTLLTDCREKLQQYFERLAKGTGAIEYEGGVPHPVLIQRIDRALAEAAVEAARDKTFDDHPLET